MTEFRSPLSRIKASRLLFALVVALILPGASACRDIAVVTGSYATLEEAETD